MPRHKTKKELLEHSQNNIDRLFELIDSFPKDQLNKEFAKGTLNRNIADVLAHLHAWHNLFLNWYKVGMKGAKPNMPFEGHSWQTLPQLNREIWEKYKSMEYKEALKLFKSSHRKVTRIIEKHSDEELFTKKLYAWTGSTSLGAYLISNSSSHYIWAYKLIKKGVK